MSDATRAGIRAQQQAERANARPMGCIYRAKIAFAAHVNGKRRDVAAGAVVPPEVLAAHTPAQLRRMEGTVLRQEWIEL